MNVELIIPKGLQPGQEHKFVRLVCEQISKDFGMLGIDFSAEDPEDWNAWHTEFLESVRQLVNEKRNILVQLLYRIDLNESLVGRELDGRSTSESTDILASLILEREAKKVWLRMNYTE